jgi:hypothetical protein
MARAATSAAAMTAAVTATDDMSKHHLVNLFFSEMKHSSLQKSGIYLMVMWSL